MAEESAMQKRRQAYRKQLRRECLEQYFEVRRKELMREYQNLRSVERGELNTEEERMAFLGEGYRRLNDTSPQDWVQVLQYLQAGLPHFHGKYQQWFDKSIIKKLTEGLKPEYLEGEAQCFILKLFTNLIISEDSDADMSARCFFRDGAVDATLQLIQNAELYRQKEACCFHFLASLCSISPQAQKDLIRTSGNHLLAFGNKILKDSEVSEQSEMLLKFAGCLSSYLKSFMRDNYLKTPDFNFTKTSIPILIDCLFQAQSNQKVLHQVLYCLFLVLKTRQEAFYFKLNKYPVFYDKLIQGLESKQLFINCINILDHLACTTFTQITRELQRRDILSILHRLACSPQTGKKYGTLCVITNIYHSLIGSEESALKFYNHPALESVAHAATTHQSIEVRSECFEVLEVLFTLLPPEESRWIYRTYQLANVAGGLLQEEDCPSKLVKHSTLILLYFLRLQPEGQLRHAVSTLVTLFHLPNVIDRIIQDPKSNREAVANAQIIYDIMVQQDPDL